MEVIGTGLLNSKDGRCRYIQGMFFIKLRTRIDHEAQQESRRMRWIYSQSAAVSRNETCCELLGMVIETLDGYSHGNRPARTIWWSD